MDVPNHALQTTQLLATSLHFWWIAFLRSSKDFWWICQQKGECLDERLVKVWEDFGDIYQYKNFSQWWQDKGPALFDSPQIEMNLVDALSAGLELLIGSDLTLPRPGMLCLAIPLSLEVGAASQAIASVFEKARIRGTHYDKDAKYQIDKVGKKALHTIVPAYLTQALKVCVAHSPSNDQINSWGGYQMARHLELCPQNAPKQGDSLALIKRKQAGMRTKHSQILRAGSELIANVEVGVFPSRKKVSAQPRWTAKQQLALDSAVKDGCWHQYDWLEHEHTFMLPENGIEQIAKDGTEIHRCLALIADMKALDQPYLETKRKRTPTKGIKPVSPQQLLGLQP